MRVLLIGGTVFIGRAVAAELVEAGHELCYVHRGTHEPDGLPEGEHIHVDRKELHSVANDVAAFRPDAVVDNVAISRADADAAIAVLPSDLRFVVTSSMDVYKAYGALHSGTSTEPVPVDETSAVREERYPYRGQSPNLKDYEKLDVEEAYAARNATIVRLPMVYGPHDYQRREEGILRRVRAGRKQIPIGSGMWLGVRGFVEDIARGMRLALENPAAAGEILNLGESRTYSMARWAQMVLDAAGSDVELVRVPDDKLPEDLGMTGAVPQHLLVDSSKARRLLGWTDTDPHEALQHTVAWHLENPPDEPDEDFSADDEALAAAI